MEIKDDNSEDIKDEGQALDFLQEQGYLVDGDQGINVLVSVMFYLSCDAKIATNQPAINAIRSIAFLMDEISTDNMTTAIKQSITEAFASEAMQRQLTSQAAEMAEKVTTAIQDNLGFTKEEQEPLSLGERINSVISDLQTATTYLRKATEEATKTVEATITKATTAIAFSCIAEFVPLSLEPNVEMTQEEQEKTWNICKREIEEANNLPTESIVKLRFIKPHNRRRAGQRVGHVNITLSV